MKKMHLLKHAIKWTEYTHKWVERGLKNRQMDAVKVFITQEVKSTCDWARKAGIPQQTLSRWLNHDELFNQCLYDVSKDYLEPAIPFGLKKLGEKIAKGDERALVFWLKYRGRM